MSWAVFVSRIARSWRRADHCFHHHRCSATSWSSVSHHSTAALRARAASRADVSACMHVATNTVLAIKTAVMTQQGAPQRRHHGDCRCAQLWPEGRGLAAALDTPRRNAENSGMPTSPLRTSRLSATSCRSPDSAVEQESVMRFTSVEVVAATIARAPSR